MSDNPLNANPFDLDAIPDRAVVADRREDAADAADAVDAADAEGDLAAPRAARSGRAGGPSSSALEERLKQGAQRFQFGALLDGPGRNARPAKQHVRASVKPAAPSAAPAPSAGAPQPPSIAAGPTSVVAPAATPTPAAPAPPPAQTARPAQPAPMARQAGRTGPALLIGAVAVVAAVAGVALHLRQPAAGSSAVPAGRTGAPGSAAASTSADQPRSPGLPDPALTPGERGAAAHADTAVPAAAQEQVRRAYGVGPGDKRSVVCRLIPAAFGGTNGPRNLFPVTPWFADLKARLDGSLEQQVKAGRMTAEQAASEETTDWIRAVHAHGVRNYGINDPTQAQQKEKQLRW